MRVLSLLFVLCGINSKFYLIETKDKLQEPAGTDYASDVHYDKLEKPAGTDYAVFIDAGASGNPITRNLDDPNRVQQLNFELNVIAVGLYKTVLLGDGKKPQLRHLRPKDDLYLKEIDNYIDALPCVKSKKSSCSPFTSDFHLTADKLVNLFVNLPPLGNKKVPELSDELIKKIFIRIQAKVDSMVFLTIYKRAVLACKELHGIKPINILDTLFATVISSAIPATKSPHPKMKQRRDPSIPIYPPELSNYITNLKETLSSKIGFRSKHPLPGLTPDESDKQLNAGQKDDLDRGWVPVKDIKLDFEQKSPVPGTEEAAMDYWREDIILSIFHAHWHSTGTRKSAYARAGESFLYMHYQMVTRYEIERYYAGISTLQPLVRQARRQRIRTQYKYVEAAGNLSMISDPRDECLLTQTSQDTLNRLEDQLNYTQIYERFGMGIEIGYHNNGHVRLGIDCSKGGQVDSSMIGQTLTAIRIPLFYRWHSEIENKNQQYKSRRFYRWDEVKPAVDVVVDSLQVRSEKTNQNTINTFYEQARLVIGFFKRKVDFKRLNHDEFTVSISLRNKKQARKNVMFRIFLIPEVFWPTPKWAVEMDHGIIQLSGRLIQTFTWRSTVNSLTSQEKEIGDAGWPCGLPHHLYLPRGRLNKQAVRFKIVVFIHDVDQSVTEGLPGKVVPASILCGSPARMTQDRRNYGFPLDQKWDLKGTNYRIEDILQNKNSLFGSISTDMYIQFKGAHSTREEERDVHYNSGDGARSGEEERDGRYNKY